MENTSRRRKRGTGQVQKIGDGVYRIRVGRGYKSDGTPRRIQETFYGSEAKANARAEQIYEELGDDVIRPSYTLREYYETVFLPSKQNTSQANINGYEYAMKHVPDEWKDAPIKEPTATEVQNWIDTMTAGTARATIRYFRAILRRAYHDGIIKQEPMRNRFTMPRRPKPTKTIWDEEDMSNVLKATRGESIEPYLLVMIGTGCRKEEALALDWEKIEFVKNKKDKIKVAWITIDKAFTEPDGEHSTKNEQSERRVPVVGYIARRLYAIHSTGAIQSGSDGRLSVGGLRRRWNNLWRVGGRVRKNVIRKDGALVGVVPKITPNAPRHSHISLMSELSVPDQTNKAYHGHSNSDIQASHYIKRYDKKLVRAAKIVAKEIDWFL